ncbi:hypothetical protein WA026_005855 [Henosepilachna vigintioctopunctata]|uniref:NADP-dependent oxidoreductase domain-containing protein n=1 Tax=Henosepilachna vigintioctopunctata TaxID=420089 RepID=A0AAW1U273_9CUCU
MANRTITLNDGTEMPVLGFGTCQFGGPETMIKPLQVAFESGYRHFDTAYTYKNEKVLGKAIAGWIERKLVERKDLFITTKLPMYGAHPERVEKFFNSSLNNLGLDYVDLYLIHFPVPVKCMEKEDTYLEEKGVFLTEETNYIEVWKILEKMVDAGKIKNIGLSNFNINQITKVLKEARIKPANLQIEVHPYFQNNELIEFCKKNGISVVAYAPLGSPELCIIFRIASVPLRNIPCIMDDDIIITLSKKYSKTPAQIILRFTMQRGLAAIPKSKNACHIKENIDIFDFQLDENDMSILASLDKGNEGRVCKLDFKGILEHPEYPFN